MGISWRCARGHLTKRRADLRFDAKGNYGCMFCMEEDAADDARAIQAGWSRHDDGLNEVTWRRAVRPDEPYANVKNRTEWRVASSKEALQIDALQHS